MAKRFTDTNKWRKKWFRGLSPKNKCFWLYLCDTCNHAGVWEVDFELASIFLGEPITEKDIKEAFKKQYIELNGGSKWFIKDFVDFQYGELNPTNRAHLSVLNILKKEGAYKLLKCPLQGHKDKDMDMDKDKDSLNKIMYEEIISDLNQKAEKNYKHTTKDIQMLIRGRWEEGFVLEDFQKVHDNMCMKWKNDPKMNQYLRPSTLYQQGKFQGYLNAKQFLSDRGIVTQKTEKSMQVMKDWVEGGNDVK